MAASPQQGRFTYIDWLRGFACVLMFEVHSYDSWLNASARETHFFKWSQLSGTLPAPLFLFLAGVSCALVTDKSRKKGIPPNQIARTMILRGLEILALGYLFRLQEYLLGLPWAPWTDLLRVDILNTIGVSIVLVGVCLSAGAVADGKHCARSRGHGGDRVGYAADLYDMASTMASMVFGVLPQWSPHFQIAAALAVSGFSLDRLRICGTGGGIFSFWRLGH